MKMFYRHILVVACSAIPLSLCAQSNPADSGQTVIDYALTKDNLVAESPDVPSSLPTQQWAIAVTPHAPDCSELQIYQSGNVSLDANTPAGILNLNYMEVDPAIPFDIGVGIDNCRNKEYTQTSGAIYTIKPITSDKDGKLILHGKLEVVAKMPKVVPGAWPAIWLLPVNTSFTFYDKNYRAPDNKAEADWPSAGEIDLIEMAGRADFGKPNQTFFTTLHYGETDTPNGYTNVIAQDLTQNFYTYSVEWTITPKDPKSSNLTDADISSITLNFTVTDEAGADITGYSARRIIGYYWPPICEIKNENSISYVATGTPATKDNNCGTALNFSFSSPSDPALQSLAKGFTAQNGGGFRLIINLASGGGMFGNDGSDNNKNQTQGIAGSTKYDVSKPLTMQVKSVKVIKYDN